MDLLKSLEESESLAADLLELVDLPLCNDSQRVNVAEFACSLAFEHWHSVRGLIGAGLLPSALVVHRSQFESILRSVWLTYAASDAVVGKLSADLNLESEQAAKNIAQTDEMMKDLAGAGPQQAHTALLRFKENSWKALNSYAHAGIHPIRRHADGYPIELMRNVLRNANGLGVLSGMHAAVLSGMQPLQREIHALAERYATCMPPRL